MFITLTRITAILAVKIDNFQMKKCNVFFFSFLIFAQNLYCGYSLEPPHLGGSNENHYVYFRAKISK